ncbi:L-aminoadipate-semialdehyde dehydrogenase-phosphopantetheinyl transferase-like isoform X1 [Orbicella faveolata]|uniref:L-aminoadipate-semialdehyde dehydrogenase-phosphopantetheinyl transferase-like isoform X1 n=2 Tax=Orbicella faveolata TaxID=48498 RepID=UPI0009E45E8A|nr:L-aminoadipate-semialdehyde dehydrogenase-phosphopantetheinyl transferase-like isoform X1 [Orbicella faveolata]
MRFARMEGVRLAFKFGAWKPTRQEWLLGISCVQSEEKDRIMKFVFKKDAKSALIGRLLMRKVISEFTQLPYNEVILKRTEKGKPYLANDSLEPSLRNFSFNISHQGDFTVLAAEPLVQVGVDVMKTTYPGSSTVPGFFNTMRKQFTSYEWQTIKSQTTEWKQLEMFYRHWCLKESYVKATGVGIGHDLQAVEFQINTNELSPQALTCDTQFFLDENEMDEWRFEETKLDDWHQVAVALGPSRTINEEKSFRISKFKELQFADIVSSAIPLFPEEESDWVAFQSKKEKNQ